MKAFALAFAVLSAITTPVSGQPSPASNSPEARHHFQEGVQSAQHGDLAKALTEFEAAYAAQPNFTVLYNIGQAHAALGHPVEAVTSFERYLAEGAERVSTQRREEVEALIVTNRQHVGEIRIVAAAAVHPRVWIDGSEIPAERLAVPVRLMEGPHAILSAEEGCSPAYGVARVLAGRTLDIELPRATACAKPLAQLQIDCDIPSVEVTVVGVTKTRTPLAAPLLVPVGDVVVQFRRPGYAEVSRRIALAQGPLTHVACEQRPLRPLPANAAGRLLVRQSPDDAQVLVDGQPFSGGSLPAGPHELVVTRDGFLPTRRFISVEPTKTTTFSASLTKTAEQVRRDQAAATRRQRWGLALGGAGVAFLGTAGGFYAWNNHRYSDWRDSTANTGSQANVSLATSVQRIDDLSIGCALLGAGLTAAGAWLFFDAR